MEEEKKGRRMDEGRGREGEKSFAPSRPSRLSMKID